MQLLLELGVFGQLGKHEDEDRAGDADVREDHLVDCLEVLSYLSESVSQLGVTASYLVHGHPTLDVDTLEHMFCRYGKAFLHSMSIKFNAGRCILMHQPLLPL